MPIENNCIKFNNNKINSLQRCDFVQNYRILQKVVQRLFQHNRKTSNHHHIQELRQRNSDSNKTCMYVHDLSLKTTIIFVSATVHEMSS
jgi:hypothetical protein